MTALGAGCKLPRLLAGVLFWLAAAWVAPAAWAANVLFLSTTEPSTTGIDYLNNTWAAISSQATAAGFTPIDRRGALSNATTPLSIPTGTQLIVVETVYTATNSARMADLVNILKTRPDLAIVAFLDGCSSCNVAYNLQPFFNAVNSIRPPTWSPMALGPFYDPLYTAYLNTASLYQSTFAAAGLNSFAAGAYTPINNVPRDYALYTRTAPPASPSDPASNVVGFFMPQTASNNGQGACVFLTADASEFQTSLAPASQFTAIAKAFIAAATDPNGACKQPAAGAPDLSATLAEPDGLVVGAAAPMTLTVTNSGLPGIVASTNGQVAVTLPTGLELVPGSLPAGCTAATVYNFTCTLPGLVPGASKEFDFQVTAPAPLSGKSATATVSGVTGEINTANNSFTLENIATSNGHPDLMVTLTGSHTLSVGIPAMMTLTVGNSDLPGVTASLDGGLVTATLSPNLQFVIDAAHPLPAGCTATATSMTCPVSALNPGESQSFDFYAVAPDPILTETAISVTVTGGGTDVDQANNTTSLGNIVAMSPDLSVTLAEPNGLVTGANAPMTLTVTNSGLPGIVASIDGQVAVTLPTELELVPGSLPAGCTAATVSSFTCTLPGLAPGASKEFDFQVTAPAPLSGKSATATVSGVTGETNTANNSFTLENIATSNGNPDLAVTLTGEHALPVRVPSKVTLTVSNSDLPGVTPSLDGGLVTATLPPNLHFVIDTTHPLPAGCTVTGASITCPVPALGRGDERSFDFYVIAPDPILTETAISATVTGGGNDVDQANNTTSLGNIVSTGSPDLLVEVTGPGTVPVNTPAPVTITVSNSDKPGVAAATAGDVEVTLPPGFALVPGSLPAACMAPASGFITCHVTNLQPGQSVDFDFKIIATSPAASGSITVEVDWDVAGPGGITSRARSDVSTLNISVAATSAAAVPAPGGLALALLTLSLAGSAAACFRRKKSRA